MIDRDGVLRLLAGGGESRNVDFKGAMNWASLTNEQKCELVKDMLAMMNTPGGGCILIGADDASHQLGALRQDAAESWDPTVVNQFLAMYTDPPNACGVKRFSLPQGNLVVVEVGEFTNTPILCKKDANRADTRSQLRQGALYIRTAAAQSREVRTADEMRELLSRGLLRQGDGLLRQIEALIKGRPAVEPDPNAAYGAELQGSLEFFTRKGLGDHIGWELAIMPTPRVANRLGDLANVQRAVRQSEVALRGWNFPHTDAVPANARNFSDGFESATRWRDSPFGNHAEAYRAYRDGFFIWRGDYWDGSQGNTLVFTTVIYQITEFLNFTARYCGYASPEASVRAQITMTGTQGRTLQSPPDSMPLLHGAYSCQEPSLSLVRDWTVSEIRADPDGVARGPIRLLFEAFNWNGATDDMIRSHQRSLRATAPGRQQA